jgi:hypothetical protein
MNDLYSRQVQKCQGEKNGTKVRRRGKKIWNMPKPCMTCTQNMSRNAEVKKTGTKGRTGGGN